MFVFMLMFNGYFGAYGKQWHLQFIADSEPQHMTLKLMPFTSIQETNLSNTEYS